MSPVVITHTEYAVKVGDRGYVGGFGDSITDEVPTRSPVDGTGPGCVFLTRKAAAETVERIQLTYRNLNAPEIADTVHIVTREVRTSQSDWQPIVTNAEGA